MADGTIKEHPCDDGWGYRSLSGPVRYPAFAIQLIDWREWEGPGNLSVTDYRLVVSEGDASIEIECTNRSGRNFFEFRGQEYDYQVSEEEDGSSFTVYCRPR